jgi:hypothetical protein
LVFGICLVFGWSLVLGCCLVFVSWLLVFVWLLSLGYWLLLGGCSVINLNLVIIFVLEKILKILIVGPDIIVSRLALVLSRSAIEVDGLSANLPLDLEALESHSYDLIIADSQLENCASLCEILCKLFSAPVYLLMSDYSDDWKIISRYRVDGFLSREISDTEIRFRILAACRRKPLVRLAV